MTHKRDVYNKNEDNPIIFMLESQNMKLSCCLVDNEIIYRINIEKCKEQEFLLGKIVKDNWTFITLSHNFESTPSTIFVLLFYHSSPLIMKP